MPGRRGEPHRHRRRLLRRPVRGDRGPGPAGAPGRGTRGYQGADADGPRAERRRAVPPPRHLRLRGQPAPPRHRPHRPVPGARVGRPDPARGNPARAGPAGLLRQGALRGGVQLRLLAADEGAGHRGAPGPAAVRQPADLLLAAGPRGRVRADPARRRPGPGRPGVEPAGGRAALRQVPQGPGGAGRLATTHRLGRAARLRPGAPVRHRGGPGQDRRTARRVGRPGGPGLHPGQAGHHLAGHRRAHRRAASRQPRGRVPHPQRRGAGPAGQGQRPAADLPVLAPGQDRP